MTHGRARSRRWRAAVYAGCAALALLLSTGLGWQLLVRSKGYPTERLSARDAASLRVFDRNGLQLWQAGSQAGHQLSWTPLQDIAPSVVAASLASEDHRFYVHSGVDAFGVLRALWLNLHSLRVAYGASTLSMQLVRLLEPELRTRSVFGKLTQALHAARLERAIGKREILEQYLNRAYYGNGAFGVGSAARTYFGTSVAQLSAGQAAFLAALPRAPRGYDPYLHRPRAEQRMRHILSRMRALGWIAERDHQLALDAPLVLRAERQQTQARHFIDHLLLTVPAEQLRGARLHTTLDLPLERELEVATRRHLSNVGSRAISQAGVIVIDNRRGDILAMVGSADYDAAGDDGAVNVTRLPRRAGSTLKPFVYGLALERGDSPATLAYDVVLPGEANETYTSDVRQHGFARYREALAGSYNLAAVHTLARVGVSSLVDRLRLAGVSTLRKPDSHYGLDLAIGNAEIELIEYVGAFAAFGNQGRAVRPRAVLRLEPSPGSAGIAASEPPFAPGAAPEGATIFSPAVAYQIFDMLADPDARRPMFGRSAPMELGFPVALKTGTTRGYTDTLAFGTTREFTVGAWAGNFDGTPTEGVMAMQGAAPLVRAAFVALAARYGEPTVPERPAELSVREICPLSGQRPGPHCPGRKLESFTPASAEALEHGATCQFHVQRGGQTGVGFPDELRHWAKAHGLPDLNRDTSGAAGSLSIVYPPSGSRFQLDPHRPAWMQRPPLQTLPATASVQLTIDGVRARDFQPSPGRHVVRAEVVRAGVVGTERGREFAESEIFFE